MLISLCLFLIVLEPTKDVKAEVSRHQGTWKVVSFVRDGEPSSKKLTDSIVRIVEGDHVVWKRAGKSFAGTTFELDPSALPRRST